MFKKTSRASIEVVEMSFVLPVAMLVVLALVYLEIGMFLLVYCNNIARETACELQSFVGQSDDIYWQIKGDFISDEDLNLVEEDFSKKLEACKILPGLSFDHSCSINGVLRIPKAYVFIEAKYFGKQIFKVEIEEDVYIPSEFANVADFGFSIFDDFEELKSIYESFF